MSEARTSILEHLRAAAPQESVSIERVLPAALPKDPLAAYTEQIQAAGGSCQLLAPDEPLDAIRWPIKRSEAQHVYSTIPDLPGAGVGLPMPAGASQPLKDLAALELSIVQGDFAVVENGAVWQQPTTPRCRAATLLAEHLVVFVPARAFVATLHQAYDRIDLSLATFGWFMAGPSKTADIEQALVLGAHGPRTMHVVFRSD